MWGWSWYGAPQMVVTDSGAARRFKLLEQQLDERLSRCVAAAEAEVLGPRGMSRQAIRRGLTELRETARTGVAKRIRQPGGWKRTRDKDPTLLRDLEHLVEPARRSGVAAALDVQERAPAGDGAAATGPSRLASVG